jgi:hypothetical protein
VNSNKNNSSKSLLINKKFIGKKPVQKWTGFFMGLTQSLSKEMGQERSLFTNKNVSENKTISYKPGEGQSQNSHHYASR